MREQADRGQVLILSQAVAEQRYGDRLTIASLAALEKGTSPDGDIEVRIIHDGTNGIDVNRYIKVLDGGLCPVAADIKCALRTQMQSGKPHIGLTVDVKEAHRMVAIRPDDWPLQACQVEPGGDIFLNRVGTYGISSAAYWWGRLAAAMHRTILSILGKNFGPWALLFADDWDLAAGGANFEATILCFVWLLVVREIPETCAFSTKSVLPAPPPEPDCGKTLNHINGTLAAGWTVVRLKSNMEKLLADSAQIRLISDSSYSLKVVSSPSRSNGGYTMFSAPEPS